jgi:hypothetical protein
LTSATTLFFQFSLLLALGDAKANTKTDGKVEKESNLRQKKR